MNEEDYPLYYNISVGWSEPIEVPRPAVLPVDCDILVFVKAFSNPVLKDYQVGDEIHLMKRTDEAPHGKQSSLGNWLAISKHGLSVWSNIEWMIADGIVEYKQ
jgi:hypothetical protein